MSKTFRKIIAGISVLAMSVSVMALPAADNSISVISANAAVTNDDYEQNYDISGRKVLTSGDYKYVVKEDGTACIFAYCGSATKVTVPGTLGGKKVTSFEYPSFCGSNITSVVMPDSVVDITEYSFRDCHNLTSVTFSKNLKDIYVNAFTDCTSLKNVVLPEGLENLYNWSFEGCTSLSSITIPKSIKYIGEDVFDGCRALKTINYTGTKAEWGKIEIDSSNNQLFNASITYSDSVKPVTPTKFTSYTCSGDAIRLNWTKVSNAAGYRIYRLNDTTRKYETLKTISGGSTVTYRDSSLEPGKTYSYKIKAYEKRNGETVWSDASAYYKTATKPKTPTISKVNVSTTSARVFWGTMRYVTGYKLQMSTDNKNWTTVKVIKAADIATGEYKITGLKKNTKYYFRICAYTNDGTKNVLGSFSAPKSATTKK